MGSVNWPTARQKKGAGSEARKARRQRAEREPIHAESMTARATRAGAYSDDGFIIAEEYDGDTDTVRLRYIRDTSLTKRQHLKLHYGRRASLLKRGNPFAAPTNIGRETSRTKEFERDKDTEFPLPANRRDDFDTPKIDLRDVLK